VERLREAARRGKLQLRLTPTRPDQALFWPMILRGAGIGLAFVPLSLVALGTLPPGQVAEGAGIYNLFRQLGGSFGIVILGTLLDRRQQFHYARLVEDLTVYDPGTQQRLAQIQAGLMERGLGAFDAKRAAYEALTGTLVNQVAVMTYIDIFHIIAYISLGAPLLLLLFQRAQNRGGASAAH
jgi:MFS transporter, DHA2 family, multidrug resistance protein